MGSQTQCLSSYGKDDHAVNAAGRQVIGVFVSWTLYSGVRCSGAPCLKKSVHILISISWLKASAWVLGDVSAGALPGCYFVEHVSSVCAGFHLHVYFYLKTDNYEDILTAPSEPLCFLTTRTLWSPEGTPVHPLTSWECFRWVPRRALPPQQCQVTLPGKPGAGLLSIVLLLSWAFWEASSRPQAVDGSCHVDTP